MWCLDHQFPKTSLMVLLKKVAGSWTRVYVIECIFRHLTPPCITVRDAWLYFASIVFLLHPLFLRVYISVFLKFSLRLISHHSVKKHGVGGGEIYFHASFTSTPDGCLWLDSRPDPCTPEESSPSTGWIGGAGWPESKPERCGEKKISPLLSRIELRTFSHPASNLVTRPSRVSLFGLSFLVLCIRNWVSMFSVSGISSFITVVHCS
jgi:hypothetical protein